MREAWEFVQDARFVSLKQISLYFGTFTYFFKIRNRSVILKSMTVQIQLTTLNSSLRLIRTKKLYSDGDELSVVYCTIFIRIDTPSVGLNFEGCLSSKNDQYITDAGHDFIPDIISM